MIAGLLSAWTFARANWKIALLALAVIALGLLKIRWERAAVALERARQQKAADEVRDRMDKVQPPGPGETEDKLRDGRF